ncbi:dUTP diphosphatase [Buchnera aphidicola]|uniref:dUTP diphosphatase n=1 Tax=Buchnera aphidicola TaxID=9 RepID=UPI00346407D3
MHTIDIKILDQRLGNEFDFIKYQTRGSCAMDLKAMILNEVVVLSQQVILIPTGISIFIKDPLITAMILPRSGLGHNHGIILGNTIGIVDSDYQGELMVSIWNRHINSFNIFPGDRFAQLMFVPIIKPIFNIVSSFRPTSRNKKGFGHSGVK